MISTYFLGIQMQLHQTEIERNSFFFLLLHATTNFAKRDAIIITRHCCLNDGQEFKCWL